MRVTAAIACMLALVAVDCSSREISGRVTAVADGDSLTITDSTRRSYRVRLQGIDAPERAQPFSNASKAALSKLVFGRDVVVVPQKTDQYGRIVGKLLVNDRDVALEQLRSGLVWFYTHFENEMAPADRARYLAAQREARLARRGLWAGDRPTPPWQFRRKPR